MKIYYYCSYKGSPVGFQLGYVDDKSLKRGLNSLSNDKINPFVRCCLETGLVRSAFGAIPAKDGEQQSFFCVKKKMQGKRDDVDYYISIAAECEKWEEFKKLMSGETSEEELASSVLDSIQLDKTNTFGYRINGNLFAVAEKTFGNVCGSNEDRLKKIHQKNRMYLNLSTATPDQKMLAEALGLEFEEYEFKYVQNEKNKMVYCEKKTFISRNKWLIMIGIILAGFSLLTVVMIILL